MFERLPPEFKASLGVLLWLNSPSTEEYQDRFKPFYSIGPVLDTSRAMTYPESNGLYNEYIDYGDRKLALPAHLKHPCTISTAKKVWKSTTEFSDPTRKSFTRTSVRFEFYTDEGMLKTKKDETTFPHRDQTYNVIISARWPDEADDKEAIEWLYNVRELFYEGATKDDVIIANNCTPPMEDVEKVLKPEIVFGKENLERLKVLKRKYDPTCFFNKWVPIKI